MLLVTQSLMGLLALGLGVLVVTDVVALWHVFVLAFGLGAVAAIDAPARQAFVSEMVGPELLANAVSLNSTIFNGARLVGPAVAGLLIGASGGNTAPAFFVNAASFAFTIGALASLRTDELRPSPPVARAAGQLRAGLAYTWAHPDLMLAMVLAFVVGTFGFNYQVTIALMSREVFDLGAEAFGLLSTCFAVGSLSGALLSTRRSVRPRQLFLVVSVVVFGLFTVAAGLMPGFVPFAVMLVPTGAAALVFSVANNSFVQLGVDPQMRGRVMALYFMCFLGGTPVGAPLIGLDLRALRCPVGPDPRRCGLRRRGSPPRSRWPRRRSWPRRARVRLRQAAAGPARGSARTTAVPRRLARRRGGRRRRAPALQAIGQRDRPSRRARSRSTVGERSAGTEGGDGTVVALLALRRSALLFFAPVRPLPGPSLRPRSGWPAGAPPAAPAAARRRPPAAAPGAARRPLQVVAADLRRLSRQLALVPAGATLVRWKALWAAYDDVLVEAAEHARGPARADDARRSGCRARRRAVAAARRAGGRRTGGARLTTSGPRVFFAVDPPEEARAHLDGALAPLRGSPGEPRWIPPGRWHLTLLFLARCRPTGCRAWWPRPPRRWPPRRHDPAPGRGRTVRAAAPSAGDVGRSGRRRPSAHRPRAGGSPTPPGARPARRGPAVPRRT